MKLSSKEMLVLESLRDADKENPVTREDLRIVTKLRDNQNREIIGKLRDNGFRIIHGTKGYWLSVDSAEYKKWADCYVKKALTILNRIRRMNNYAEGQVEMDE